MSIFLFILSHNIIPLFLLIMLGFLLGKKFDLHIGSFSKLMFYAFVPAFIFVNLYTADLQLNMINVLLCGALLIISHHLIGLLTAKLRGYPRGLENAFKNSIMFNNSGNIGVSLITLVFTSPPFVINGQTPYLHDAITAQVIILVLQNITSNTVGLYNAGRSKLTVKMSLRKVLAMPPIYIIPLALLLQASPFDVTAATLWPALVHLKNGMVPMSLLTLGIQLSKTHFDFSNTEIYLSSFVKLMISPLLALTFIWAFGFTGVVAQTILIAHSVPTAVNTALIAMEFDNHQDFASQAVMLSTIASTVTLTLAIYAARVLYPV